MLGPAFRRPTDRNDPFPHRVGAVAQLGERLICIQEVAGSIPTSSTKFELLWPRPTQPQAVWSAKRFLGVLRGQKMGL